jgi:hypothetical protein
MLQSLGTCLPAWLARDMAAPEDLTPLVEVPAQLREGHAIAIQIFVFSPNSSSYSKRFKD